MRPGHDSENHATERSSPHFGPAVLFALLAILATGCVSNQTTGRVDMSTAGPNQISFGETNLGDRTASSRSRVRDGKLHIVIPENDTSPITLSLTTPRDFSAYRYLLSTIHNTGPETVVLRVSVCDAGGKHFWHWGHYAPGVVVIRPGETKPLAVCLAGERSAYEYLPEYFPKMAQLPGMFEFTFWRKLDASAIAGVQLVPVGTDTDGDRRITLTPFRGALTISAPTEDELKTGSFFPFIDQYGQYSKLNWPDKIRLDKDLLAMRQKEDRWLAGRSPRPTGWNRYGGWADGPQLKATGHFRTEKYKDKWWLVDPDGRLFWSKGSTGIAFSIGGRTPIEPKPRRRFFVNVPKNAILRNRQGNKELIIGGQMEKLKYGDLQGDAWKNERTVDRAWTFGLNTAGAWSSVRQTDNQKLPYVVMLHPWSAVFQKKLFDPFHPSFRKSIEHAVERTVSNAANDPWCLGYFINNELHWESPAVLGRKALVHSPKNSAKQALLDQLKTKYGTVEKLNAAWNRSYSSWDAILTARKTDDGNETMTTDLTAFGLHFCDTFFRTISEVMKDKAPNKLYLGGRFNKNVRETITACARYADVVSFNKYDLGIEDLRLPAGSEDKPILIGEFCFVRGGRRHVSAELGGVYDSDYRGRAYAQYVSGALRNPAIVGCHWFQWNTQPVTGRRDGENYEQGFIDTCDTPYWGLAHYSRSLANHMYELRLQGTSRFDYQPPEPGSRTKERDAVKLKRNKK